MTLRQSVERAINQNPEMVMARLDQQKAELQIRVAKDPFTPKVVVGSGAAYTTGYPQSIGGNPPSIIQAKTIMSVYNAPQRFQLAQARENARTSGIDESAKREDVAFRTANLFLDVEKTVQSLDSARKEVENYQRVSDIIQARIGEGQELPITGKIATFNLNRAKQRVESLQLDADYGEASLAVVLGMTAADRVHPVNGENEIPAGATTEDAAVQQALDNSRDLRRLQSQILAKRFEQKSYESARRPQIDLVAQYAMLARYAFQDFFPKFQRNNGQLGVSIALPLLAGTASAAQAEQARTDIMRLQTQVNATREQLILDTRKGYQDVKRSQNAREIAREDLDLSREQVSVLLAQMREGRASLRQVEEARSAESEKWIAFYDAQSTYEKAQLNLLKQTGSIVASLR